jgi:hypothetical protein
MPDIIGLIISDSPFYTKTKGGLKMQPVKGKFYNIPGNIINGI